MYYLRSFSKFYATITKIYIFSSFFRFHFSLVYKSMYSIRKRAIWKNFIIVHIYNDTQELSKFLLLNITQNRKWKICLINNG